MPQEGLELCDGVDTAPNPGTGTSPTTLSFLFAHPLPLWSLSEGEWGHYFIPSPPRHGFSAVPYADMRNHSHGVNVMCKPWPAPPVFVPLVPPVSPSVHHLLHHGARDVKVGLPRVGDHQVIDVVPLLSPHVA